MRTTVHTYCFNLKKSAEAAAWENLRSRLSASHPHCMESHGGKLHYMPELDGIEVELETKHLFSNQWNTAPLPDSKLGLRLFDWALDYNPHGNPSIKQGHWLDQTEEMRSVRHDTLKCGYCAAQYGPLHGTAPANGFCDACLDSAYLKERDLHLLRLIPIDADVPHRAFPPLSDAERAALVPAWKDAQMHGTTVRGKERIARQRETIEKEHVNTLDNAAAKRGGLLWLLDHGISIDNVIFYTHTRRFGFGWRGPVADADALRVELKDFPYPYDITTKE